MAYGKRSREPGKLASTFKFVGIVLFGAMLGALALVFKPVVVLDRPPEETNPEAPVERHRVVFVKGRDRPLTLSRYKAHEAAFRSRSAESIDLREQEINRWLASTFASKNLQKEWPDYDAAFMPHPPKVRLEGGKTSIGLSTDIKVLGAKFSFVVHALGKLQAAGEGISFIPEQLYLGSLRIPAVLRRSVFDWIAGIYRVPEAYEESFRAIRTVSVDDGRLTLGLVTPRATVATTEARAADVSASVPSEVATASEAEAAEEETMAEAMALAAGESAATTEAAVAGPDAEAAAPATGSFPADPLAAPEVDPITGEPILPGEPMPAVAAADDEGPATAEPDTTAASDAAPAAPDVEASPESEDAPAADEAPAVEPPVQDGAEAAPQPPEEPGSSAQPETETAADADSSEAAPEAPEQAPATEDAGAPDAPATETSSEAGGESPQTEGAPPAATPTTDGTEADAAETPANKSATTAPETGGSEETAAPEEAAVSSESGSDGASDQAAVGQSEESGPSGGAAASDGGEAETPVPPVTEAPSEDDFLSEDGV